MHGRSPFGFLIDKVCSVQQTGVVDGGGKRVIRAKLCILLPVLNEIDNIDRVINALEGLDSGVIVRIPFPVPIRRRRSSGLTR